MLGWALLCLGVVINCVKARMWVYASKYKLKVDKFRPSWILPFGFLQSMWGAVFFGKHHPLTLDSQELLFDRHLLPLSDGGQITLQLIL